MPCIVLQYDSTQGLYLIEWIPSGLRKRVHRLNILFAEEEKELYYQRIENAVRRKKNYEEALKYRKMVLSSFSSPIAPLSNTIKVRFLERIGRPITVGEVDIIVSFAIIIIGRMHG
jgi:hypothetical protein